MVELAEIGIILQTIGVLSAATAAVIGVRSYINSNKHSEEAKKKEQETRERDLETREAQLFMGVFAHMMNPEFAEAERTLQDAKFESFEDYSKLLKDEKFAKSLSVVSYWLEGIGVLVRENLIDIRLPTLLYSGMITWYWEKYRPMCLASRKEWDYPRVMAEAEYLADKVKEYAKLHPELGISIPKMVAG